MSQWNVLHAISSCPSPQIAGILKVGNHRACRAHQPSCCKAWCRGESCAHLPQAILWLHLQSSLGFVWRSLSWETCHAWVYPFFEWTSSSEASLWTDIFSFSSLYELFARDWVGFFSNFLVSMAWNDNGLGGFGLIFWLEDLLKWWWRRVTTVVVFYFRVELVTLRGFSFCPSTKTLFVASLVVWVKVSQFVWRRPSLWP